MKLLFVYMGLQIFLAANLFAQNIQLPDISNETVTGKALYRFASFEDGKILFRNGNVSFARLNYNISHDEMNFIAQTGDTLALANTDSIQFIILNGSRFYYNKGFLQSILIQDGLVLAFKQKLAVEQQLGKVFPGNSASIQSNVNLDYFTGNGQIHKLGERQFMLTATEKYFLGDENGNFQKASQEFVLEHYKKSQGPIKAYMKKNHTCFNCLEDLVNLLQYCRKAGP